MAVKLRLMRMGKKKQPTYRIVAADSRAGRDGRFIEVVGTYAPRSEPSVVNVDNAKAIAWLTKGAQPTDTVRKLLQISGAWGEFAGARPSRSAAKATGSAPATAGTAPTAPTAGTTTPTAPGEAAAGASAAEAPVTAGAEAAAE